MREREAVVRSLLAALDTIVRGAQSPTGNTGF
jgi:hypothetical protein